jgi:hypothetical protein
MPPSQANSPSINGGGNINGESDACQTEKKKSDFCFDEEAQVKQRQSEVAQLAGKGSAKGALAIFQQLQKSASSSSNNNFVDRQPSFRQGVKSTNKFCTLPRKCQTNAVNSPDNSHHNSLQRLVDVKPLKQKVEPQPSNSSRSHHHPLPISTALPSNNGKPFVDNGKPADNADNNENQQQKESPPSEPVYASPPVKDVIRRMNISTERQPVLPAVAVSSKMVISPAESDYHHQQQQQQANRPAGPRQQPATTLKITPMAKWWNEHVTPPASPSFHHKQQQKASCMFPPASPSASPAPSSASSTGVVNAVKGQTVILHKVQSADGWQRNAISASPSPLMFLHHYQHRPPSVQPYDTNPPLPSAGSSSSSQSLNGSQTIFARAFPARVATRNNPHFDKIRYIKDFLE